MVFMLHTERFAVMYFESDVLQSWSDESINHLVDKQKSNLQIF